MINYRKAVELYNSDTNYKFVGGFDKYKNLVWLDQEVAKPTKQKLKTLYQNHIEELENSKYKIKREIEYPSIQEQLDMIYHDEKNGTTTWIDTIDAIKDKYPKN